MADVAQKNDRPAQGAAAKDYEIFANKNSMLYKINTVS